MGSLLYFLSRFGGLLTFITLEVVSLYLVVQYNQTQRSIFINSSQIYSGYFLDKMERVQTLTNMSANLDSIAQENARIYARLYGQIAHAGPELTSDSLLSQYDILPVRIIKNSITLEHNNLTIDKGSRHGIRKGMGLMLPDGVLGIVRATSANFSSVISVLNKRSHISASLSRSQAFGSLTWGGKDPQKLVLAEVPKHLPIYLGDTVSTSGHSAVFPAGIPIGTVTNYYVPSGSNSYHIDVAIFADIARAKRAYVIYNRNWDELEQLERSVE